MGITGRSAMLRSNDRMVKVAFHLNGEQISVEVSPCDSALTVLRDQLGLKGTKEGCGIGECGACTILVDGKPVDSCLMFAPQLDGREVQTVEGLSAGEDPHPLQEAFLSRGSVQCGYCTPGMLMSAKALLEANPRPTREDIVEGLSGNLCRCTGYVQILEAVEAAVENASNHRSEK
jgi:aerobic-type carbon monoxide dehydrogenase small subunit (CoxS/CutS family)